MTKVTISPDSELLILKAAEDVFRAKGFKRGTVRDIAQISEMSVGAVASLGPKEQLLVRVMERKIGDAQRSSELSMRSVGLTPGEAIVRQLGGFFDLYEQEWSFAREYAAVLATGRYESEVFPGLASELIDGFRQAIQADGSVNHEARAAELAQSIYLAYLGSLYLWTSLGVDQRAVCEQQLGTTIRLLLE